MEPPLSIERFAELNAEMDAGLPRAEVLARAGVSPEDWKASQQAWLGRLAAEVSASQFELTNRYGAAFMARNKELEERKQDTPAPAAAPAPAPVSAAAPLAAPAAAPTPPPVISAPPSPVPAPPPVVAAPPRVHVAAASLDQTIVPGQARSPWAAEVTSDTKPIDPKAAMGQGSAMPFRPSTPGDVQILSRPSSPLAAPKPKAPQDELNTTTEARVSPFAVLPFQGAEPPKAAAPEPPARPAPGPKAAPLDPLNTTSDAKVSPFAVMPFQGAKAAPAEPRPAAPPGAGGLPFRPAQGTASAPEAPQQPADAPAEPRLSLEQFAALAAEIAQDPGSMAQIRGRYHLSEAAHRAEATAWQRRFAKDPALFARYSGLFQHYRDWYAKGRR